MPTTSTAAWKTPPAPRIVCFALALYPGPARTRAEGPEPGSTRRGDQGPGSRREPRRPRPSREATQTLQFHVGVHDADAAFEFCCMAKLLPGAGGRRASKRAGA
eukprot:3724764-Prymnesium_polylepis.1